MTTTYIKSPLNYTGGKHKLLPDILPAFPQHIRKFADIFAGGFNVGINVEADEIFCNDHITYLIELFQFFRETNLASIKEAICKRIADFALTDVNDEGYNELRVAYNASPNPLDLFVLICYSFNHQMRFNSKHEFNTPFGRERSAYNNNIERNLTMFCGALQKKNIKLSNLDFSAFDFSDFNEHDMAYCDPPYLISTGSYNDGKRGFKNWTEKEERALLYLLDRLNSAKVKFALSNVFCHKGEVNNLLIEWSRRYIVHYIDKTYSNCSYHFKDRNAKTIEVLITNYP